MHPKVRHEGIKITAAADQENSIQNLAVRAPAKEPPQDHQNIPSPARAMKARENQELWDRAIAVHQQTDRDEMIAMHLQIANRELPREAENQNHLSIDQKKQKAMIGLENREALTVAKNERRGHHHQMNADRA